MYQKCSSVVTETSHSLAKTSAVMLPGIYVNYTAKYKTKKALLTGEKHSPVSRYMVIKSVQHIPERTTDDILMTG
jgi:hypothetical protein